MSEITRPVIEVIDPRFVIEGAGVRLRRSFGPHSSNLFDPFLLFDHFAFNDPAEGPIAGFPTHPHRGIETVTYMLAGSVRHRDSLGNLGVIGPGDVQWMTSGRGILHEEMPHRNPEGLITGFQLWVNLPAAEKMSAPRYQEVSAATIPVIEQDGALVRVVAGQYAGISGPVTQIAARPLYMDVTLQPGAEFDLDIAPEHTVIVYLFEGAAWFGEQSQPEERIPAVRMLKFGDGSRFHALASEDSPARFMLMAGAPFGEPIFPYGPFVMNTREEIEQTLRDLRAGTFVQDSAIAG